MTDASKDTTPPDPCHLKTLLGPLSGHGVGDHDGPIALVRLAAKYIQLEALKSMQAMFETQSLEAHRQVTLIRKEIAELEGPEK